MQWRVRWCPTTTSLLETPSGASARTEHIRKSRICASVAPCGQSGRPNINVLNQQSSLPRCNQRSIPFYFVCSGIENLLNEKTSK